MELLKLQALTSYVFLALETPFPILPSSAAFFLAIGIGRFLKLRSGLRVYIHAVVHLILFIVMVYLTYAWYRGGVFDIPSLIPKDNPSYINISAVSVTLLVFWLRAVWLEGINLDHEFLAERFDEGLGVFLGSILIAAIVHLANPLPGRLFIPYLAFSILSLGFSRQQGTKDTARGGFPPKTQKTLFAEISAALVLAGIGISRLVPVMTGPAKNAAESIRRVGAGLLEYIAIFLTWLFRPRQPSRLAVQDSSARMMGEPPPPMADEPSMFGTIAVWIILSAAAVFCLILLGYLLTALFKWLGKKVNVQEKRHSSRGFLSRFFALIGKLDEFFRILLLKIKNRLNRNYSSDPATIQVYRAMLRKGKSAGVSRKTNETPREYATRLAGAFPKSTIGIDFLILTLEREIYGEIIPTPEETATIKGFGARMHRYCFTLEKIRRTLGKWGSRRHFRH